MEDASIIALYWQRDEEALRQTETAYGAKLHRLHHPGGSLSIPVLATENSCTGWIFLI